MSTLDNYRNTVIKKREELAKLTGDLSKEQAKISPLQKKINSASDAIRRTKNQSTIKTKSREIDQCNKSIADTNKKCSDLQKKIAQKEKELATAEKNVRNEEDKVNKKKLAEDKKRLREQTAQFNAIEQTIQEHAFIQASMQSDIAQLKAIPATITVLFLAANPNDTQQLNLDEEVRAIQNRIRLSDYRDSIRFESRWAARSSDVLQAINETNPTIIHFSGHGTSDGKLVLLNPDGSSNDVTKEAITMAISTASDTVRLVVFNACFSESQAKNIVHSIESAIGMNDSIRDDTAITFASQLYSSIGFGHSLEKSFNQAIAAIMLDGIPQDTIPQLFVADGVNPDDIVLVSPD